MKKNKSITHKILIIGRSGFIGNHCFNYFKNLGYDVYSTSISLESKDSKSFLLDKQDLCFDNIFKLQFDICINCSGMAIVSDSFNDPTKDFQLNTINVFKILDSIRKFSPQCKFINLSSAAVYGNPSEIPIKESSIFNAISPYGYHKIYSELICEEFNKIFNINTCSLRIFSAYGNGLKKQLLWDVYNKLTDKTSNIASFFGTGNETRDYIHISDILTAIHLIVLHAPFNGEYYNLANGTQISVKSIILIFIEYLKSNKEIKYLGIEKKGDPINWEADITQLKKLGYIQKMSINDGIKQYIEWARSEKK